MNEHQPDCPLAPYDPLSLIETYTTSIKCTCNEEDCAPTTQDAYKDRIKEVLEDFESILDWSVDDTDDPDVIDITIRGRLKDDLGQPQTQKDDPASDYDRAMKGLPCEPYSNTNLRS